MTTRIGVVRFVAITSAIASGATLANAQLGSIDFPTSGAAAARPAFERGVLLLHSFEYDDAKEAFVEAQRLDPGFAMAYWGEAMTYNHPLWSQTAPDPARAALNRLAPTAAGRQAKAPTQKEKDWLASVEALYGPGDKLGRDVTYADALGRMYAADPTDLEVTSFYALALLGTSHGGRDFSIYMRAAALAESVYSKNPKHPGAVHYLIHAYDDPIHAPLGLRYADAYGTLAADASHALHMPTHIYFALGRWDRAAVMNERSVRAADARIAAKRLGTEDRAFHALIWLSYGYLQQGRYQDARGVITQLEADVAKSGSTRTRSHLALARAAWLVETRRWADAKPAVTPTGLGRDARASDLFGLGLAAAKTGQRDVALQIRREIGVLAGEKPDASPAAAHADHQPGQPATGRPVAGAGGDPRGAAIMAAELDAVLLMADGRRDEAVARARQAAAQEEAISFEFGPPVPVKPAHELVGDLLLEAGRAADAQKAYAAALKRTPGRALSLLGLMRAATAAGDQATAKRAADDLRVVWERADSNLPELKELGKPRGL